MGRKIVITEEQYEKIKKHISEGVLPNKTTIESPNTLSSASEQDIKQDASNVIKNAGVDPKNVRVKEKVGKLNFVVDGESVTNNNSTTTESKIITKNEMIEHRLAKLRENSKVYSVGDFLKMLK